MSTEVKNNSDILGDAEKELKMCISRKILHLYLRYLLDKIFYFLNAICSWDKRIKPE